MRTFIDFNISSFASSDPHSAHPTKEQRIKILIFEDDQDLNNLLKFTLEAARNYEVISFFDGHNALEHILHESPDLVILDLMLPVQTGLDILRNVRNTPNLFDLPVVLLTAKSQERDKVEGFESGADDYITKPFSPRELLLRVNALLRRSHPVKEITPGLNMGNENPPNSQDNSLQPTAGEGTAAIRIANLVIYPELFRVTVDNERIALTSTEYQLLLYLAQRKDRLQSRDLLLQKVWGYEGTLNTRTVDTHVKRLRQKLGSAGLLIETVHGFGYQLSENSLKKNTPTRLLSNELQQPL